MYFRAIVTGVIKRLEPVRVADFWIKRIRDSDLQTDSDAGVSRRANEGVYVTFDQNGRKCSFEFVAAGLED